MYQRYFKRLIDISLSLLAITFLLPLFLVIYVALLFTNNGKPFFSQERPGWKERPFKVIKFKTMSDHKDQEGNLLPNHMRTTKVGSFLRKTSLDEIPQLINVIKGDMSLVGPRPLLFKYLPLYSAEQRRRHEVRPGITGWAQVNGRNAISWSKKFELDVYYVENKTFWFDIKVLYLTVCKVIKSEGVNLSETITSEPFNGRN
jgi:undecaprenyl phosphate N,N'-diacetylbacillosamine 1-phosphate transferase